MFNLQGEVIGINTAIFSPSGGSVGIGFAIPSALAKPVINQIIEYGRTRRGWLGVRIQNVTDDIADSLGLDKARGALIASVNEDGPAQKAGLAAGDIILKFNGQDVHSMRELPRIVAETKVDATIDVEFWRDSKIHTTRATVGELEKAEEDGLIETGSTQTEPDSGQMLEEFGIGLSAIGATDRQAYNIPATLDGVLIGKVADLSVAAEQGILPGDVIVEVEQKNVKKPEDVIGIVEKAKTDAKKSILFLLNREGTVRFVALKFPEKPEIKKSE